jgi:hypothetical protein
MPLLDLFEPELTDETLISRGHLATSPPVEMAEAWDKSVENGLLFGMSVAHQVARERAARDVSNDIYKKTGRWLPPPTGYWDPLRGTATLDAFNKQLEALRPDHPDLPEAYTEEKLNEAAIERSRKARTDYQHMAARERTWGGTLGLFGGAAAAGIADPITAFTIPFGAAGSMGILRTGLMEAGVNVFGQVGIEAASAPFKEKAQPGYSASGEATQNVLEAGAIGFGIGAGVKTLGVAWRGAKNRYWPDEVRDAGNVVESEAQIAETNVAPGGPASVVHRENLRRATEGRPDLEEMPPEAVRGYEERIRPALEARERAVGATREAVAIERTELLRPFERDTNTLIEGRIALEARAAEVEARAAEAERLRAEVAPIRERLEAIAAEADPVTAARLATIEEELARPGVGRDVSELLRGERETIRASLEGDPALQRERGSLGQEIAGRTKELGRLDKAIARERAALAKAQAKLEAAETKLTTTRDLTIARAEDTQTRASASQRQARDYWTEQARKEIRRLALEAGYEMTQAESAALAKRIVRASAPEARAILDETLLRPRTIAAMPPGSKIGSPTEAPAPAPVRPGTDAPDFEQFFAGSKAVDADGKPLPLFHGTDADFQRFSQERAGYATGADDAKHGFFFASNIETARSYGTDWNLYQALRLGRILEKISGGYYSKANEWLMKKLGVSGLIREGKVLTTYLSIKNPLEIDAAGRSLEGDEMLLLMTRSKKEGHDGLLIRNTRDDGFDDVGDALTDIWVAHRPDQVRIVASTKSDLASDPGWELRHPNAQLPTELRMPVPHEEGVPAPAVPARLDLERAASMTQKNIDDVLASPEVRGAVFADLDRLRNDIPTFEVPTQAVDAEGRPLLDSDGRPLMVKRKLEDQLAEIEEDLAAARELRACSTFQEAAE